MSSDYFPSNEEPWWSSADARAVSVAADPARKQRLPPSGYDLPFCCHLLSLLDFSSHKTIARGAWRKATSALRLPALGAQPPRRCSGASRSRAAWVCLRCAAST